MPLEREDIEIYFDTLNDKVDGINNRLDRLNGRTLENTVDIAVLQSQQEQSKTSARNQAAGWGATAGTILGTVVLTVYQFIWGK